MRAATAALAAAAAAATVGAAAFRPPAVPLIVHEPFVSIWSPADNLTDAFPSFWAGQTLGWLGLVRVDGAAFRWLGEDTFSAGPPVPPAQQTALTVGATQTRYTFVAGGVVLTAVFTTPALGTPAGWSSWVANPVSYITLAVASFDGAPHAVQLYLEHTAELAVNNLSTPVTWSRDSPYTVPRTTVLRLGSAGQPVLGASGDGARISWGYQYLAVPDATGGVTDALNTTTTLTGNVAASRAFVAGGPAALPPDDPTVPRPCDDGWIVAAAAWDMGTVLPGINGGATHVAVAYDTVMGLSYYGAQLAPAWTAGGTRTVATLLADALGGYDAAMAACAAFDAQTRADLAAAAGGDGRYADVASLAHRQVVGSMTFVTPPRRAPACAGGAGNTLTDYWAFMEEQSSDGDVSTVDVLYPASPWLLYHAPEALWAALVPIFDYAANCSRQPGWDYGLPWAPHDLGTWPVAARGPAQQEQMPLEESGNMLIMAGGVVAALGGRVDFIAPYQWALLQGWADFCNASLPLPPSQLATDDFAGPAPNNTNLVVKGLVALGAWAQLLELRGDAAGAAAYRGWAAGHAAFLRAHATDASTPGLPRLKRQYQLPDGSSWSLKYNALYEYVLGTGTVPRDLIRAELAYYLGAQARPFGVPLDDRYSFALTEYMGALLGLAGAEAAANASWVPALLTQVADFVSATQPRVPMTDWYNASTAARVGFQARATVGDLWALALLHRGVKRPSAAGAGAA